MATDHKNDVLKALQTMRTRIWGMWNERGALSSSRRS